MMILYTLFFSISQLCADEDEKWQTSTYTFDNLTFSVQLPGAVKEVKKQPLLPSCSHTYWICESESGVYVMTADVGESNPNNISDLLFDYTLDYFLIFIDYYPKEKGPPRLWACVYRHIKDKRYIYVNVFVLKRHLLALMTMTSQPVSSSQHLKFVQSLKVP